MDVKSLSCVISPSVGGESASKTASIPFVVHSAKDGLTRNGKYYWHAPPPVCLPSSLPDVITYDQISQAFPLCICILLVIKYWRQKRPGNEAMETPSLDWVTISINLAYHDGRIAGCETLHLPSSPESEKPGVVSPMVLCRLFRFPVVTLLGKYHRVCRFSRPVWVFTCDP